MALKLAKPRYSAVTTIREALGVRKLVSESAGYSVLAANNLATAMELFSSSAVDLVLSDHVLEDCTGTELATAIKRLKPDVPIVIFSGLVDAPEGMEHADPFISKIDSPPEFLRQISELLKATGVQ